MYNSNKTVPSVSVNFANATVRARSISDELLLRVFDKRVGTLKVFSFRSA